MDKKKTIYASIILFCIIVTVYVMFFMGKGGTPNNSVVTEDLTAPVTVTGTTHTATGNVDLSQIQFSAPSVFPNGDQFESQVLSSSKFQSLTDYTPLSSTAEEYNREDPFVKY